MESQEKRKCLQNYFNMMFSNSLIHNCLKLETTQIFIKSGMNKQIVEYLYNGILLKDKKIKVPQITWINLDEHAE